MGKDLIRINKHGRVKLVISMDSSRSKRKDGDDDDDDDSDDDKDKKRDEQKDKVKERSQLDRKKKDGYVDYIIEQVYAAWA